MIFKRLAFVLLSALVIPFVITPSAAQAIGPTSADVAQLDSGDSSFPTSRVDYNYVDGLGYSKGGYVYPGDNSGDRNVTIVKLRPLRKYQVTWFAKDGSSGTRWISGNVQSFIDLRKGTKIVILDIDNV